jgi:hypothetical protein
VYITEKEFELTTLAKSTIPPLCIKQWRPKTNGWLLVVAATGGAYASRTWAKMVLDETLAHRELKTGSLSLKGENMKG